MSLRGLALRTFLWLPPCFAAWFAVAAWHAEVAAWLAWGVIGLVAPGAVGSFERSGAIVAFTTTGEIAVAAGQMGVLVPEVNALSYLYGLPLFAALVLGSRAPLRQLALGAIALLPVQAFGIAMGCLAQLVAHGSAAAGSAGLVGWRVEAVVLGFQLGSLILPGAAPILLWCAWNRRLIRPEPQPPRSADAPASAAPARTP